MGGLKTGKVAVAIPHAARLGFRAARGWLDWTPTMRGGAGMTPDDIAILQKRLRLNRAQFARVLGMSAARLYALGGEALMREAYYDAKAENPAVTVIQAYWDGIGGWRW